MGTTKQDYKAATERLQTADHLIGKLTHQIIQARVRAFDCKRKASQIDLLPDGASMDDHAAAAVGIAAECAKHEAERRYWAHYHEQLMGQIEGARKAAADAKRACAEVAANFWRERFGEQVQAFFDSNKGALSDLYGSYARLSETAPSEREFWGALLPHLPNAERLKPGLWATEKVIPSSLPETAHLRPIDSAEHHMPANLAEFLRVGPNVDAENIAELKQRAVHFAELVAQSDEKVAAARRSVDLAAAAIHGGRYQAEIENLESALSVAKHNLKQLEANAADLVTRQAECLQELREAEEELARLEAVRI